MKDLKILFMHNTAMWYRIPFFKHVAKKYNLKLTFTHIQVIEDIYSNDAQNQIKGLEGVNYNILKNSGGFARGFVSELLSDYEVVIGGSWDCIQELIETILLVIVVKIRRKKFIIWREDWDWKKEDSLKEKVLESVIKFITHNADAILVPGSLHRDYFKNRLNNDPEKIFIMPNVSNISSNAQLISKDKSHKTVLYVGRLIKRKGVIYLIKAYEQLSKEFDNIELVIVGGGEEEESLKKYVQENDIPNIKFTGKIDNEELESYYIKSNLVVVPSINDTMADPWVFVLNEAMYYSNPIIATDNVGASRDMIKGNGFIVSQRSSEELYSAMKKILSDNNLEEKMSKKSVDIINNEYQYSNMIESFDNAIKYILK